MTGPFGGIGCARARRQRRAGSGRTIGAHAVQIGVRICLDCGGARKIAAGDIDRRPRCGIGGLVGLAVPARHRAIALHGFGVGVIARLARIGVLIAWNLPGCARSLGQSFVGSAQRASKPTRLGLGLVRCHRHRRGRGRRCGRRDARVDRGRQDRQIFDQVVGRRDIDLRACWHGGEDRAKEQQCWREPGPDPPREGVRAHISPASASWRARHRRHRRLARAPKQSSRVRIRP